MSTGQTTAQTVPIGLMITRTAVPGMARRLAEDLFHCTRGDIYKYLPDDAAKEDFAREIGNCLHIILNQMNIDQRRCKHCGGTQQDHEWVSGWCRHSGQRFEPKE